MVDGETKARFQYAGQGWLLTLADYALVEREGAAEKQAEQPKQLRKGLLDGEAPTYEKVSPDGTRFATEKDFNLGIRRAGTLAIDMLTTDGTKDYPWSVNQALWSPDGQRLAVLRADSRKVPKQPVVPWLNPDLPVVLYPATRPGSAVPQYELVVIDTGTKKARARRLLTAGRTSRSSPSAGRRTAAKFCSSGRTVSASRWSWWPRRARVPRASSYGKRPPRLSRCP